MKPFRTLFNPLIAILQLFFIAVFVGFCLSSFMKKDMFLILGIGGAVLIAVSKRLFSTTKRYTLFENYIEEYNYLTFSTKFIDKPEIRGFSTSMVPYRIWDFDQVIIYLTNGEKIILMQFSYLNFSKIDSALTERNYTYLGDELYNNEIGKGRKYKFDA